MWVQSIARKSPLDNIYAPLSQLLAGLMTFSALPDDSDQLYDPSVNTASPPPPKDDG